MMKFNEKLKEARKKANMTQKDLADAAGISTRMVQMYEYGTHYPRANVAKALSDVLGVSVTYLLSENDAILADAEEKGGVTARRDIDALINEVSALFAGGELAENEKDEVIEALTFAYWDAKKKNKKLSAK